jgi:hypothetical protein
MAKYGMSMCTLGHSGEFKKYGIAVNSLWPRTAIATAALQMIPGVDVNMCRKPEILSDAAYFILTSPGSNSGNFFIDDELLAAHGVTDLDRYSVKPAPELHSGFLRGFGIAELDRQRRPHEVAVPRTPCRSQSPSRLLPLADGLWRGCIAREHCPGCVKRGS